MKHALVVLLLAGWLQIGGCAATQGRKVSSEAPRNASEISPIVMDHFVQAKVFEFNRDYRSAIVELGALLAHDPIPCSVYRALARDYLILGDQGAALGFMTRAVQAEPGSLSARRFLSMLYAGMGDLDNAIEQSEQIVEREAYAPEPVLDLVGLYLSNDQPDKAIALLEQLQIRHPSPEVQMHLASVYQATGHMAQAETLLKKLLQEYPDIEEVAFALGSSLEEAGKRGESLSVYENALEKRPTYERIRRRLGTLYMAAEKWDRAIFHFARLPQDLETAQNIAMAYYHLEDFVNALRTAQDALARYGDDASLYYYLGRSLTEMKDLPEALKAFEALIRLDETRVDGWMNSGYIYLSMECYAEAQSLLEKGVERLPTNSRMWFLLGVALADQEDLQGAVSALERALALDPENVTYLFELGRVQDRAGQFDEGIRTFEKLLSVNPEHALALNYLGYLFADRGIRLDESLTMLKKVVAQDSLNGAFLDSLGWVYFRLGDLENAERYIEQAAQLEEENAVIIEHLGDVAATLGNTTEARRQWERALELDPGNRSVQDKLEQMGN
ncbi:MAG: tetratricopeptide repeat protein [Candidatus Latescibacterota bacterium]